MTIEKGHTMKISQRVIRFLCLFGLWLGLGLQAHAQTDTVTYVYTDPQGTPLVKADASGNVIARYDYTPYGNAVTSLGSPPNGPGYTGHVNDPETGLVYMQARYYQPDGRFLSPDPIGLIPGNIYAFNRYAYVNDNPYRYTDPTGKATCGNSSKTCSLSKKGLQFIVRHEGFRKKVYKDGAGNPTIGYGHLVKKTNEYSNGITKSLAKKLLSNDAKAAVKAVNAKIPGHLSQHKFDSLTDFTYNEGRGNLSKSKLLRNINDGKSVTKKNFTDWNEAGGKIEPGLTRRRSDEFDLYSNGNYGGR